MSAAPTRTRAFYAAVEEVVAADAGTHSGETRILCPFCTSSKTGRADRSLAFNYDNGKFWCHRCESKGRLRGYGDPDEDGVRPARCMQVTLGAEAPRVAFAPPEGYTRLGDGEGAESDVFAAARAFAFSRGVTQEVAIEYGVGATVRGRYAGRLVLPCVGDDGVWWGYVTRSYRPDAAYKYLYPEGIPRKSRLVHEHVLDTPTDEPVLVVEGWLDTVPFLGDAVAVMGKPSAEQLALLARSMRPVCFVPDGDAWLGGEANALALRFEGQRAGFVRLPPKFDPDQVDPTWLREEARRSLG